jgi:ATP-dependent helicase Lhr and Lhr-like helicase
LAALDALVRRGLDASDGKLPDATAVVYVSPLKALSNDVHRNLELPLAGIAEELERAALPAVEIRTLVRTGDTPSSELAYVLSVLPEEVHPGAEARERLPDAPLSSGGDFQKSAGGEEA